MRRYIELDESQPAGGPVPRALGLRGIEQIEELEEALAQLPDIPIRTHLLYFECDEAVLVRRYSESRRRHPLMGRSGRGLLRSLRDERDALSGVREKADFLVDTTSLTPHTLMLRLESIVASLSGEYRPLLAHVQSFGFKKGTPSDAEWIWDVRFLPNPYYDLDLRACSGVESAVADVVFKDPASTRVLDRMLETFIDLLRAYVAQGRRLVNIGIGCTGGQHRSVAVAERLAQACLQEGFVVSICHRDVVLPEGLEESRAKLLKPTSAAALSRPA